MEITEINALINAVELKINEIKEMLADYRICKNATSKTQLLITINKLASQFKTVQTVTR